MKGEGARRWPRDLPKLKPGRPQPMPAARNEENHGPSLPSIPPAKSRPRAAVHWIYGMCKLNARKAFIKPDVVGNKDAEKCLLVLSTASALAGASVTMSLVGQVPHLQACWSDLLDLKQTPFQVGRVYKMPACPPASLRLLWSRRQDAKGD